MCHPDGPSPTASTPDVASAEIAIPLADGAAMPAFLARADGAASRGAVMIVGDIFGARTPFYEHLATLIAAAGLDAIVPEFFFRTGPLPEPSYEAALARKAKLDERQALRDLDQAISWVRDQSDFHGARVGILGFCLGGTFVLDLAATRGDLATVCYYGFPAGPPGPPGDPERAMPKPLDEVDRIQGPLLGFWGDQDERVGQANVEAFARALGERGIDFEHTVFAGLDHGFLQAAFEPGTEGHDAARSSWERALGFFAKHLGG
jgi:carboxymethylenebutenolidase